MAGAPIVFFLASNLSFYMSFLEKKIGIILVNYKDYANHFLLACRDSLRLQEYPAHLRPVYIVDNESSSESRDFLQANYPEAKILPRLDGNYCAANNLGCQAAIADGCEFLVAVNMDTEMSPGWLKEMLAAFNSPDVGLVQAKIMLYDQNQKDNKKQKINTLGNRLHFLGFGFTSSYREEDREILGYPEIDGYASGCSLMMRADIFKKIGGWDELYYMYHDDVELSLKIRLAGYKIVLAPKAVIFHKYEFSRSVRMLYFMERNRYLLVLSFYPKKLIAFLLPAIIAMHLGMLLFASINGWLTTWFRISAYFLRPSSWRLIMLKRKELKKIAQKDFSLIIPSLAAKIEFLEIDNFLLRKLVNPIFALYWRGIKKLI